MVELQKAVLDAPMRSAWLLIAISALVFLPGGALLAPFASRGIDLLFDRLRHAADAVAREKHEVETLYRTYFDNTTESLFIVVVTPDGRFMFEALNPVHEHLTGLKTEAIRGKEPHECLSPEMAAWITGNYRRCVDGGVPIRYDEVLTLPGGTRTITFNGTGTEPVVAITSSTGAGVTFVPAAATVTFDRIIGTGDFDDAPSIVFPNPAGAPSLSNGATCVGGTTPGAPCDPANGIGGNRCTNLGRR